MPISSFVEARGAMSVAVRNTTEWGWGWDMGNELTLRGGGGGGGTEKGGGGSGTTKYAYELPGGTVILVFTLTRQGVVPRVFGVELRRSNHRATYVPCQ